MSVWLAVGFVFAALWAFWWWLGKVFDAIGDWQAALRREDSQSARERGD